MGCGQEWAEDHERDLERRAREGDEKAQHELDEKNAGRSSYDPWASPHWTYPCDR